MLTSLYLQMGELCSAVLRIKAVCMRGVSSVGSPASAATYSPHYLAARSVRYQNPRPLHGWLHPALFRELAPPANLPEAERRRAWARWWEAQWPHIQRLSRAEFNQLVLQVIPDADPCFLGRLPLPRWCDPDFTGPRHIRRKRPVAASPNALVANAHPLILAISGVMLYLAGLGRPTFKPQPHTQVIVAPSSRHVAAILGVSRQHIMRLIKQEGGPGALIEQLTVAQPAEGKGRAIKQGQHRYTAAHPTNTYRIHVSEDAIAMARFLTALLGPPDEAESSMILRSAVTWVMDEELLPPRAMARAWHQAIQDARAALPLTHVLRLVRKLRPAAFDGRRLSLSGAAPPMAAVMLKRLSRIPIEFESVSWLG